MKGFTTLFTLLSALATTNALAIEKPVEKRATRVIAAADATTSGFTFPRERNVQPFSVDTAGYYRINIRGAGGGLGGIDTGSVAGKGATVQGAYVLLPGETYLAVVGERGNSGRGTPEISAGGGGGGSFVYRSDNTLLVAAGGGGGNSYNGTYVGLDALSSAATIGDGFGGAANPGAGAGGAGFGIQDENGTRGNGANAGTVQGAKGGQTKNTWAGGAVDSRQTGAGGRGGFGGGGGGGKYSGGGGGGFTGGAGGPIPGNLGRPMSPGSGGTSNVRTDSFNGFIARETSYGGGNQVGDGAVTIRFLPYYVSPQGPYVAPVTVPDTEVIAA